MVHKSLWRIGSVPKMCIISIRCAFKAYWNIMISSSLWAYKVHPKAIILAYPCTFKPFLFLPCLKPALCVPVYSQWMKLFRVHQHLSHRHAQKVRNTLPFMGVSGIAWTPPTSGRASMWHRAAYARTSAYIGTSNDANGKTIVEALLWHRKSNLAYYT